MRSIRVGVDTGGTFTDFVYQASHVIEVFKLPSTPADPSIAIRAGLERISSTTGVDANAIEVVHGTTVGTNALLQRRGARIALITTRGFEDVIAIGRQARPELYNLNAVRPEPLVPSALRFGVKERVVANGTILEHLDERELSKLLRRLTRAKVEAVAICLLFSFLNPEHEKTIARVLKPLKIPLSSSHEILPEYREFERTSTMTINAYLQPLMGRYLNRLSAVSAGRSKLKRSISLRVMQSSGGSISSDVAASEPVRTVLSGPAGGVVGALRVATTAGFPNVITFDMGGTSTDVALCAEGAVRTTNEAMVAGLPVAVPVMDIHTVGAGGGSIAHVDAGGSLRVGPASAGADPGPACYGRSMLPTVTDAHVVLGHFAGRGLLGGEFSLDASRARTAMEELAAQMSEASGRKCTPNAAAEGVIAVANANMERALRHISVERGHDPRQFVLLPFGGAGGLHAVELARSIKVPRVIVPRAAGALSAIGVLVADVVKEQSRTVMVAYEPGRLKKVKQALRDLETKGRVVLRREGFVTSRQRHEHSLGMRYVGQSFELEVKDTGEDLAATFHRAHRERYGYAQEESAIEIVSARVRSIGLVETFSEPVLKRSRTQPKPAEITNAVFSGQRQRVALYFRDDLGVGAVLETPCIVSEYSATTLIPGDATARVDQVGNLVIE